MRFLRIFRASVRALRRNVMRAILTTLGIIIGIAAVIAMMEIGHGASTAIQNTIASIGANTLTVLPGNSQAFGVSAGAGSNLTLTPQDADAIVRECPAITDVAPMVRARTQVIYGNRNWLPGQISGTTPAYLRVRNWTNMDKGDVFSDRDVRNGSKVCLIGQTGVSQLFPDEDPIGKDIRVQNVGFKVVGVLEAPKRQHVAAEDQDDDLLGPLDHHQIPCFQLVAGQQQPGRFILHRHQHRRQFNQQSVPQRHHRVLRGPLHHRAGGYAFARASFTNVDHIQVAVHSAQEMPQAIKEITELLRERHRLKPADNDDFTIRDPTEFTTALTSTTTRMTWLLLCVAVISLIVGGVGIMNIMLVSVTERTREIGLRMAVGARARDILLQFLFEAVVLCMVGGGMSVYPRFLPRQLVHGVQKFLHYPTEASRPGDDCRGAGVGQRRNIMIQSTPLLLSDEELLHAFLPAFEPVRRRRSPMPLGFSRRLHGWPRLPCAQARRNARRLGRHADQACHHPAQRDGRQTCQSGPLVDSLQ